MMSLNLDKFMSEISVEKEHRMARDSALYVVQRFQPTTLQEVIRKTGLAEIRAARALSELVKKGSIEKHGKRYILSQEDGV
jgi:predicted transcriptional regulator